jgi:hypothetical protein
MDISQIITIIGVSILFFYCLTKILNFYSIDISVYGIYIAFFWFMIISTIILPHKYPQV